MQLIRRSQDKKPWAGARSRLRRLGPGLDCSTYSDFHSSTCPMDIGDNSPY